MMLCIECHCVFDILVMLLLSLHTLCVDRTPC